MPVSGFQYDRLRGALDYRRFNGRGFVDFEIEFTGQDDPLLLMIWDRLRVQNEQRIAKEGGADPTALG